MNLFQLFGIALFGCLMAASLSRVIRRRSIPKSSIVWLSIWSAGIVSLLNPNEMTRLARVFGVSRGADLLLYVSVVSGLLIAFVIYTRMRQTDRQITLIVRELALSTVEAPAGFVSAGAEPFSQSSELGEFGTDDSFFGSAPDGDSGAKGQEADRNER